MRSNYLIILFIIFFSSGWFFNRSSARPDDFDSPELNPKVLQLALNAQAIAKEKQQTSSDIITIIDYSLPSTAKRFWTINTKTHQLLFHDYIAHGQGSGKLYAKNFSNVGQSHASSLGLFKAEDTYLGKHGRSLKLAGLEPGFNDQALRRHVVIHSANYVSKKFINHSGYLGRSWGCPAVSPSLAPKLIQKIKGGSLVFAYYPDKKWLSNSDYISNNLI